MTDEDDSGSCFAFSRPGRWLSAYVRTVSAQEVMTSDCMMVTTTFVRVTCCAGKLSLLFT